MHLKNLEVPSASEECILAQNAIFPPFYHFLIYFCRAQHITLFFRQTLTSRQSDQTVFIQISKFTSDEINSRKISKGSRCKKPNSSRLNL